MTNQRADMPSYDEIKKIISQSVVHVIETLTRIKPVVVQAQTNERKFDIFGEVEFEFQELGVKVTVAFEEAAIFLIASKVYNRQFLEIDSSINQGVGEITNMIVGHIKTSLAEMGSTSRLSLPRVQLSTDVDKSKYQHNEGIMFEFSGAFFITILEKTHK